jgi:hypothetical protein
VSAIARNASNPSESLPHEIIKQLERLNLVVDVSQGSAVPQRDILYGLGVVFDRLEGYVRTVLFDDPLIDQG